MTNEQLGWNAELASAFEQYARMGCIAGRVAEEHRNGYDIITERGEIHGEVTGAVRHRAVSRIDLPTVGDWVAVIVHDDTLATIHGVLPRRSIFSRKAAGEVTEEQPVAANVDTLVVVTGLDDNFNVRRIERYLVLAWESGAQPVIVLNKADLAENLDEAVMAVENVAAGTPVVVTSAAAGEGLAALEPWLRPGRTLALVGSSGVGKSTLINALAGSGIRATSDVSGSVGKGRHTTTSRELIVLPNGALVIDTPGMREIGLWGDEDSLAGTFQDIEELFGACRFNDCRHEREPGCAVNAALEDGTLDEGRWHSYLKLQRELAYLDRRHNTQAMLAEKAIWKRRHREALQRPNKRT